jgi:NADH-quinone oxidoreductase subunit E
MSDIFSEISEPAIASRNDPMENPDLKQTIDLILEQYRQLPGATMVVLNELQNTVGYITEPMQAYVADEMDVPVAAIHGVVTFYSFFTTQPRGRHTIKFCNGTACYVGGTTQLIEKAKQALGIDIGQTTPDGAVTLETCRCVGACSQAPVVVVDDEALGHVRPNKFPQVLRKVQETKI